MDSSWHSLRDRKRADQIRDAQLAAAMGPPVEDSLHTADVKAPKVGVINAKFLTCFTLFFLAVVTTIFLGAGILGKSLDPTILVGGAIVSGILGKMTYNFSAGVPAKFKTITTSIITLALASFIIGALTNPIVIQGQVVSNFSSEATQVRYIEQLRDDLYTLRSLDAELALPDAQAWSKTKELTENKATAVTIADKYKQVLETNSLPAGELADPTKGIISSAYLVVSSYTTKSSILASNAPDTKPEAQLNEQRTAFANELVTTGASLAEATDSLGYDINLSRSN